MSTLSKTQSNPHKAYVVHSFPPEHDGKYGFPDSATKTQEEKQFMNLFVRIFFAAANGDLKTCQDVIENHHFKDIDAYTLGKLIDTRTRMSLDYISPRQIAQINGHAQVTSYFLKRFGGPRVSQNTKDSGFNLQFTVEEDKERYEFYKKLCKSYFFIGLDSGTILDLIRLKIASAYPLKERRKEIALLEKMDIFELFQRAKTRSEEKFTTDDFDVRGCQLELFGIRDALQEILFFGKNLP